MPRRGAFYVRGLCIAVAFTASVGAIGCSGASASALFADGDDSGAPTVNGDASTGESIDAGHDAAAPAHDASTPIPSDDSGAIATDPADAADPIADFGIRCGATTCTAAGDVCCRMASGASGSPHGGDDDTFACLPAGTCAVLPSALAIPCDDAADCEASGHPGGICCASLDAQTGEAESIACTSAQACTGVLQTNLCATDAPAACPNGGTCKISQTTIPGYDICF